MNTFELLRSAYRRLRGIPILGPIVEALRYRRFPVVSSAKRQYEQQQVLIEAHGHALSGLRHAAAVSQDLLQAIHLRQERLEQFEQEIQSKAQEEFAKNIHLLNEQNDAHRRQYDHDTLALSQRFEFQRMELMFERRYSASAASGMSTLTAGPESPRIINTPKLNAQRAQNALRLNVGCGHKPEADRLNVDMRELPGVDIIANAMKLPFSEGELQEIFSSHVLEHFPLEQLRRQLLPAWFKLLRQGGELRAIVPDAQAMLQAHAQGDLDFDTLCLITFGGQEYEGDFHHTMFTPENLLTLFTKAGLVNVRVEARARRNGLCLEFEIVGAKP